MNNWVKFLLLLVIGWGAWLIGPWDDSELGIFLGAVVQCVLALISGLWLYFAVIELAMPELDRKMSPARWFLLGVMSFIFVALAVIGGMGLWAPFAPIPVVIAMGLAAVVSLVLIAATALPEVPDI